MGSEMCIRDRNYLVGRSIIRRKATPLQLGEVCKTVSDVRKYTPTCRPPINKMAQQASFKNYTCENKNLKIGTDENFSSGVVCEGFLETKIGTGQVSVFFQKSNQKWNARNVKIINESWVKKT